MLLLLILLLLLLLFLLLILLLLLLLIMLLPGHLFQENIYEWCATCMQQGGSFFLLLPKSWGAGWGTRSSGG